MLSEIMCRRIFHQQRQQEKEAQLRETCSKTCFKTCSKTLSRTCSGRLQGRRTVGVGGPTGLHPLRPVNVKGVRARGMRAPQNTNQFLMQEKYQMQHLRSDSVGSDCSCGSDSDSELTDMDSYLGVLENARGALLDSPDPQDSTAPPGPLLVLHRDGPGPLQEDSMQYFPSEDDLLQSQNFMQRDFVEFCDFLSL